MLKGTKQRKTQTVKVLRRINFIGEKCNSLKTEKERLLEKLSEITFFLSISVPKWLIFIAEDVSTYLSIQFLITCQ